MMCDGTLAHDGRQVLRWFCVDFPHRDWHSTRQLESLSEPAVGYDSHAPDSCFWSTLS